MGYLICSLALSMYLLKRWADQEWPSEEKPLEPVFDEVWNLANDELGIEVIEEEEDDEYEDDNLED